SPPVIRITLARPARAGLSRRTGGVLTMKFVSIVTASASAARAAGASLQTASATHAPKSREDPLNSFAGQTDISPSKSHYFSSSSVSKSQSLSKIQGQCALGGGPRSQHHASTF